MIILGIDPGSVICGYGVIEKIGSKVSLKEYGVVKAKKISEDLPRRMLEIFERIESVVKRNSPDTGALESLFYSKNAQSLMKLSHARASGILPLIRAGIEVSEYSPREVKKSVTGNGNAGKEQVSFMVRSILNIDETPEFFDATDALAVALCHAYRMSGGDKGSRNWKDFLKQRPDMIVDPSKV